MTSDNNKILYQLMEKGMYENVEKLHMNFYIKIVYEKSVDGQKKHNFGCEIINKL